MDNSSEQSAVRVVFKEDGKFVLDETSLQEVLEGVLDMELAVISVAGAFRKGKSFFLNFCLRYLEHITQAKGGDWLGDEDAVLTGFSWKNGCNRDTEGILLWKKPFIIQVPDGCQKAVLLMDTEGIFDCSATVKDTSTIFALSLLSSSLQIYNVQSNIGADNIQNLQYFAEYAKVVRECEPRPTAFQKMVFLVRDWQCQYEFDYGLEGGSTFLERRLQTSDDEPEELRGLKAGVRSYFDELACCLLPHPGKTVATKQNFQGRLNDVDDEFVDQVKKFIPAVLAPETIPVKLLGQTKATGREFFKYFKACVEAFQGCGLPDPRTAYACITDSMLQQTSQQAIKCYKTAMIQKCQSGKYLKSEQFFRLHVGHREHALQQFMLTNKFGDHEAVGQCYRKLCRDLDHLKKKYEDLNEQNNPFYPVRRAFAQFAAIPSSLTKTGVIAGPVATAGGAAAIGAGLVVATGPIGIAVAAATGIVAAVTGAIMTGVSAWKVHKHLREYRQLQDEQSDFDDVPTSE